jgi:transcriptional regulator with XRE-family HTH domain
MASPVEDIRLGRWVVANSELEPLRKTLGLSRSAMAELLYTTNASYRTWERNPKTMLWPESAERIGRFFRAATVQLEVWGSKDLAGMVPLYVAGTLLATPQEILVKWYREGLIDCQDLGILGLWVRRTDLKRIRTDKSTMIRRAA